MSTHDFGYYSAKVLGKSLNEMEIEIISSEDEGLMSRWYHGPLDAEISMWTCMKNKVLKVQVICIGQVVSWNAWDGIRTGAVMEEDTGLELVGESIKFDQEPQPMALKMAAEFVAEAGFVEESMRAQLLDALANKTEFSKSIPPKKLMRYLNKKAS